MIKPLPSYAAIVTRCTGLGCDRGVILLTDDAMLGTARLIRGDCAAFVKDFEIINLDEADDYEKIYALTPDDLLILFIGIESWTGRHKKMAYAFGKPERVAAKYICIRPTVTAEALLDGLNTPPELTESIVKKYGNLPAGEPIRVTAKSGTDLALKLSGIWTIPFDARGPGANAYLPPAEISYEIIPGSADGVIVVDITVGELRVNAELIDPFGLVRELVTINIQNGEVLDIAGGEQTRRLKAELWKLPDCCKKIVEFGIGLSRMEPSGIIGIDESIAGTCHFGFGNGSGNDAPIHLDVVIADFHVLPVDL